MLKTISKSNITQRSFNAYKEWEITNDTYPIESASLSNNKSKYKSILAKYYRKDANPFNLYGTTSNIARIDSERTIVDEFNIIDIPQNKYGEQIKPNSVVYTDLDNSISFNDNGNSELTSLSPIYTIVSLDLSSSEIVIIDNDLEEFTLTIGNLDLDSGEVVLTFGGNSDSVIFATIDFETATLTTESDIEISGLNIDKLSYGNIFYSDGLIVLTNNTLSDRYKLTYKSTKTIHETEVLVSVNEGQFNYSQNPSAVEVTLSGSYDFTTTAVNNAFPSQTKKIKEVLDIKRKQTYTGTTGSNQGTWNDYFESSSTDPTGSYLTPFITTIGLYDNDNNMIAVAKLPKPIKNLPDYDVNFIVRLDT